MLCGVALLLFTVALSPSTTPVDGAANVDGAVGSAGMLRRPSVVLESALAKPRPSGTYGAGRPILPIHCAKNEAESFLVVVSGGASGLTDVVVDFPAPLAGAAVSLHAARYVNATKATGCTGATGLWADPLVPAVDVYAGERRNAFPLTVPAGENRIVWVDLFVPKGASAGNSMHPVTVTGAGGFSSTLHINLTIFNFTLPTTPSMRSHFGMPTWNAVASSHNSTHNSTLTDSLFKRYIKSGLMHRVTFGNFLSDGSAQMQSDAANGESGFWDEWGEFISNVALPFGPSPGQLSSVQAPAIICGLSWDKHSNRFNNCTAAAFVQQIRYWRNLSRSFDEKGRLPLLFDYSVDEPKCKTGDGRWDVLKRRAAMVKQANPHMQTLVTTSAEAARNYSAFGLIDVFVPIINDLSLKQRQKPDPDKPLGWDFCEQNSLCSAKLKTDQRSLYDFVKPGNLWTYQSCMSYGVYMYTPVLSYHLAQSLCVSLWLTCARTSCPWYVNVWCGRLRSQLYMCREHERREQCLLRGLALLCNRSRRPVRACFGSSQPCDGMGELPHPSGWRALCSHRTKFQYARRLLGER